MKKLTYAEFLDAQKEIMNNYNMGFYTDNEFHSLLIELSMNQIEHECNSKNSLTLAEQEFALMVIKRAFKDYPSKYKAMFYSLIEKLEFHIQRLKKEMFEGKQ